MAGGAVTDRSKKMGGIVNNFPWLGEGAIVGFSVGTDTSVGTGVSPASLSSAGACVNLLNQKLSWASSFGFSVLDIFFTVTEITATAVAMSVMVDTKDRRTR